jgi:energy-converting hydrogenase A subunit M
MAARFDHAKPVRLHARSAQVRLRAINAQISAGFTLCKLIEIDIGRGRTDEAHKLIGKLRKMVETVRRHVQEPHHLPTDSLTDVRQELVQLEERVLAV